MGAAKKMNALDSGGAAREEPSACLSFTVIVDENDREEAEGIMGDIFGESPESEDGRMVVHLPLAPFRGSDGGDELLRDLKVELIRANIKGRAFLSRS